MSWNRRSAWTGRCTNITAALYNENGQNFGTFGTWPRLPTDPGGENEIIVFKSCFPNSALQGDPGEAPPPIDSNPLRGQDAYSEFHTIANAKGIYIDLLNYFSTRQDKMFVVITAPPLIDGAWGSNARAFNDWLMNDWLTGYPYNNVAVFDFYNVLTSNGGDPDTNDLGWTDGNHHRWWNGAVQHQQTVTNDTTAYPTSGDDHPSRAGNEKATGEFVQLLNVFYHRWADSQATPGPTNTPGPPTATSVPGDTEVGYLPVVPKEPVGGATPTPTPTPPGPTTTPDLVRPLPDTSDGIHVFNDQLVPWMTEAQYQFAATHYDGTQKMTRSDADHLRSYNPDFVILHYRLGLGLGYQEVDGSTCTPNGNWLLIIEGDDWVQEWPAAPQDSWFYLYGGERVLNCDWGWYLMNPADSPWRHYIGGEWLRQLQANDDDGLFLDSVSVPNYMGADHYVPPLPAIDPTFENEWATLIEDGIAYSQQGPLAPYHLIPNAGSWVTTRDPTDYSGADGVMIEGFAEWGWASYFELADWQLQLDRILGLVNLDKAILAQQYVDPADVDDRMFILGTYLLIKGGHTYINMDIDLEAEWFPEYEIPIGTPEGGTPATIADLWNAGWGVYARNYSNGLVLVNPTLDTQVIDLGGTYYLATPNGGGLVPADGDVSIWTVNYTAVTSVTLAPNRAVVLLSTAP